MNRISEGAYQAISVNLNAMMMYEMNIVNGIRPSHHSISDFVEFLKHEKITPKTPKKMKLCDKNRKVSMTPFSAKFEMLLWMKLIFSG